MVIISIIVPVYNVAEYLPKCIDSIRKQIEQNWELIFAHRCAIFILRNNVNKKAHGKDAVTGRSCFPGAKERIVYNNESA